jgi:cytochrome c oxidase subunit 2
MRKLLMSDRGDDGLSLASRRRMVRRALRACAPALLAAGCAPAPATEQAREVRWLYDFFMVAGAIVFVTVAGLILWSVVRYRDDGNPELPPQFHEHRRLEVTWTVIPVLIVMVLIALTLRTVGVVDHETADPAVTVRATGFQWQWKFEYLHQGISETGSVGHEPVLVLPVGQPVHLELVSADVQHSFYVPRFLFKRDVIPGRVNHFDLTLSAPGTYQGECAFICGLDHARMGFKVQALPPAEFQRWLAAARAHAAAGQPATTTTTTSQRVAP